MSGRRLHAIAPRLFGDTELHEIPLTESDHAAAFGAMWQDYAQGMLNNVPTRQTGEDGKRAVEIVQAAYRSNATGRTIDLPLSID
jgi:predicted dehydrogenase